MTATTNENTSTPAPVVFSFPLTLLDEVELSTTHEPQCYQSLLQDNDDFWDTLDVFDDCMCNSDTKIHGLVWLMKNNIKCLKYKLQVKNK